MSADNRISKIHVELMVPGPEFLVPESYTKINHIDDDNIRWHLAESAHQQVHIAKLYSDAEYYQAKFKLAAQQRASAVFLDIKSKPYERYVAKAGRVLTDATDAVCEHCAKVDYLTRQYMDCFLRWKQTADYLQGALEAFKTKTTFLASLCGLRRAELEAISARERNVLPS